MKKATPFLVLLLVIFLFTFHANQYFSIQSSKKSNNLSELQNKKRNVKKVFYGEGEYEKVSSKWNALLVTLNVKVLENMTNHVEKEVLLNYIDLGKQYEIIWEEMIKIEAPPKYKTKHENLILEAEYASKLCDSYLNQLNQFDNYFKSYFIYHYKNHK